MTSFPDESFLALVPVQVLPWEPGEGDTVVLVRPKILSPRWGWLVRLMAKPVYRVKLDPRGTAAWRACDGTATVAQVIEAVAEAFPGAADPVRTALFLRELALGGFIRLQG
ncbi:MAG: PqqD family protein [Acidobacteriota bacterium]|nr:PqqD family protein [Acidobacteriota bacterium]